MAARRGSCPPFPLPAPIDPPISPCMSRDVSGGFYFQGNVLDDWKATWSDLRDTTCNRFITSFPLLLNSWFLFWGGGGVSHLVAQRQHKRWNGFRRIVDTGLALLFLPLASAGVTCPLRRSVPACPCFLKWRNAGWGHSEWGSVNASEMCMRHKQPGRRRGGWAWRRLLRV